MLKSVEKEYILTQGFKIPKGLTLEQCWDKTSFTTIQKAIIEVLIVNPSARRDIVKKINYPRTTVYENLIKLYKARIVVKSQKKIKATSIGKAFSRGRPLVIWSLTIRYNNYIKNRI